MGGQLLVSSLLFRFVKLKSEIWKLKIKLCQNGNKFNVYLYFLTVCIWVYTTYIYEKNYFNYTTEIHSFVWDWFKGSNRAAVKWKVEPKAGQKNKHSRTIVHKEKATYHISLYYFDVQQGQVVSVQICERQTLCILQSKCTD